MFLSANFEYIDGGNAGFGKFNFSLFFHDFTLLFFDSNLVIYSEFAMMSLEKVEEVEPKEFLSRLAKTFIHR